MELSLVDMHCDTAYEMYKKRVSFENSELAVSLENAKKYIKYTQTMAIWSDSELSDDEAFRQFKKIYEYLQNQLAQLKTDTSRKIILAVEDARLLANDLTRLDYLQNLGVKILTLVWSGVSCIGGAHDTDVGLTDFGKRVVSRCFELGIVPDISHSSRKTAAEIFELNTKNLPIIASHSDSFSIHPHTRNILDEEFLYIKTVGGLVGINLYTEHLGISEDFDCALAKVIDHIEHFLALGGENTVCFGCDFDGAITPKSLKNVGELYRIADKMSAIGYSDILIEKIFSLNAETFIKKNFMM